MESINDKVQTGFKHGCNGQSLFGTENPRPSSEAPALFGAKVYDLQKRPVEKRRKLPKERLGQEGRLVEHDAVHIIDQRYERGDFFLVVVA